MPFKYGTVKMAKETNCYIVPFSITGKYKKAFKIKTTFENARTKRNTWYVANGEHRLSHLLEEGHATKNGGRTQAFPHIKYGAEYAQNNLPRKIQEAIDDIK